MTFQPSSSAERAVSIVEDGRIIPEAEEAFASGQHDPDTERTHVTETQFAESYALEMDYLSQSSTNHCLGSEAGGDSKAEAQLLPHLEPQAVPPPGYSGTSALRFSRHEIQAEESQGFAFQAARKTQMKFGRSMGQRNVPAMGQEANSAPTPLHLCKTSPAIPRAVEPQSTALCRPSSIAPQPAQTMPNGRNQRQDQAPQQKILVEQHSNGQDDSASAISVSAQASNANVFQNSEIVADDADKVVAQNHSIPSHASTTQSTAERKSSDILSVWSGQAQAAPIKCHEELPPSHSRCNQARLDSAQPSSSATRLHPAIRPGPSLPVDPQPMSSPTTSRVTKGRRKSKAPKETRIPPVPTYSNGPDSVPSQEDLLTILLFRTRQEKRSRDAAKAVLQAKEVELEVAGQASEKLRTQMQELAQRESAQREELSKYQQVLPALKGKAKKLDAFMTALTKDYNMLRINAETIHKQQEHLCMNQSDVKTAITEARETLGANKTDKAKILAEARHYIAKLEQQIQDQEHRNDNTLHRLEAEQERSLRLEQEISNVTTTQQEMMELLRSLRQAMADKLDEILKQPSPIFPLPDADSEHPNGLLDRCLEILKEIKVAQSARPDDMQQLENSLSDYAEKLSESLQQLVEASKRCRSDQLKFKRGLQKQFEGLSTSIKAEQSHSGQVIDLREIKATLKERAQASETALVEARQMIVGLQGREQLLVQQVSGLKVEVSTLFNRPREDPEAAARLRQAGARNSELEAEVAKLLSNSSEHARKLRENTDMITGLHEQVTALGSQLEDSKVANVLLEKLKSGCEAQADARYEKLRCQLLGAANAERAILTGEQAKSLREMQRKITAAESKAKGLEKELAELKETQANETARSIQVQTELKGLRARVNESGEELTQVREKLRLTEEDLRLTEGDLNLKRAEKQLLEEADLDKARQLAEVEALLAKNISESKSHEEGRLRRINNALQSNGSAEGHTDVDEALEALFTSLAESRSPYSQNPMLHDLGSSQELVSGHEAFESVATTDHGPEYPQNIQYARDLYTYPHRVSPVTHETHSQDHEAQRKTQTIADVVKNNKNDGYSQRSVNHDELVIQESQIEKTTIRRNLTTTRSSRGCHGATALFETPSRRPQVRLSHINNEIPLSAIESPHLDAENLFPPTPIPILRSGSVTRPSSIAEQTQSRQASSSRVGREEVSPGGNGTSESASVPLHKQTRAQQSAPALRGILRQPYLKRRMGSEYGLTPGERPSKRQSSAVEKHGLGPIIPDSSQHSPITSTKMQKSRKSRRVSGPDKFTRRFHGRE